VDFCVLTEVRCDESNIKKAKLHRGMEPALYSVSPQARGGIVVFSNPSYELINHSVRRSSTPGHFAIGVYTAPDKSKLIVAGIYGPSANDDAESFRFYQEVNEALAELQNTFQTRKLIMAGDFNAVLSPEDSSSEHVTKKRTTELLLEIIAENHLIDMATLMNKKQHTWYRRNNNKISSRLDLILTNLPIVRPRYSISITIFDHTWVQASFGQAKQATTPSMKDFVLGSEEFLIGFYELLEQRLASCKPQTELADTDMHEPGVPLPRRQRNHDSLSMSSSSNTSQNPREADLDQTMAGPEDNQDRNRLPMDFGLSAHDVHSGRTDLHFINDLLYRFSAFWLRSKCSICSYQLNK
jgi:exonuclease III